MMYAIWDRKNKSFIKQSIIIGFYNYKMTMCFHTDEHAGAYRLNNGMETDNFMIRPVTIQPKEKR